MIQMEVSQVLSGISKDDFINTPNVIQAFVESVANTLGLSNNTIHVTNVTEFNSSTTTTIIQKRSSKKHQQQQYKPVKHSYLRSKLRNLVSNNKKLQIDYVIIVVVDPVDMDNPTSIINSLQDTIQISVSSGEFTDTLLTISQSYSIEVLNSVTLDTVVIQDVRVVYNSASPTSSPTFSPTQIVKERSEPNQLVTTNDLIIILVLCIFFLVCVIIILIYYFIKVKRNYKIIPVAPSTPNFDEVHHAPISIEMNKPTSEPIEKKKSNQIYVVGEEHEI